MGPKILESITKTALLEYCTIRGLPVVYEHILQQLGVQMKVFFFEFGVVWTHNIVTSSYNT